MATHDKARWHPPLKAPLEAIHLLSDSDSTDTAREISEHKGKHDAQSTISKAHEKPDSEIQWPSPLKAPAVQLEDSLSRDVSKALSEALVHDDDAKARDASPEGSDSDQGSQWSLYEDALGTDEDELALGSGTNSCNPIQFFAMLTYVADGSCTLDESLAFRRRLRLIGGDRFVEETVNAGVITAKKLCTAFGIRPPFFLEGEPDEAYYSLLDLAICRELSKRAKLPQYNTIDDAVTLMKKSRNIIILTGAGVGS